MSRASLIRVALLAVGLVVLGVLWSGWSALILVPVFLIFLWRVWRRPAPRI